MFKPKSSKELTGEQLEFYQLALDGAKFELDMKIHSLQKEHKKEMDSKLKEKDIELNETKDELNETKDELNETKDELNETKSKLDVFVRTVMKLLHCSYDEAIERVLDKKEKDVSLM